MRHSSLSRSGIFAAGVVVCVTFAPHAFAMISDNENALDIIGQLQDETVAAPVGEYTKSAQNNGPNVLGFYNPRTAIIDSTNHRLFVADFGNNRVLVHTLNADHTFIDRIPDYVLGQSNLYSNPGCPASASQTSMCGPVDLYYDTNTDRLFVADSTNHRVLVFSGATLSNGMNAAKVLGQTNFTSRAAANTQAGMNNPHGITMDTNTNHLFVTNYSANRVTVYSGSVAQLTDGMNAAKVLGQTNFTNATTGTTQSTMFSPQGVAYDAARNRLWVSDSTNSRVLMFSGALLANGMNAAKVLGQTTFTASTAANTQAGMNDAEGVAYDAANSRLFVAMQGQHAVKVYSVTNVTNGMSAVNILGQTTFTASTAANSQSRMNQPLSLYYDRTSSGLYVTQLGNHRITVYDLDAISNGENATNVIGQYDDTIPSPGPIYTKYKLNNGPNKLGFDGSEDVALDANHNRLFVADQANNRVLAYNLNTNGLFTDRIPDFVLGQSNFYSGNAANTQAGMNNPVGLAYGSNNNRLYVSQSGSHRVTIYSGATLATGMNAAKVLGQTTFTASTAANSQSRMNTPYGIALDTVNDLIYVANNGCACVKMYSGAALTNGKNATRVLGQTTFTGTTPANTQAGMGYPYGIAHDFYRRLYVAQASSNRVTVYNVNGISNGENAINVLGQANFTASTAANSQAGMKNPVALAIDEVYWPTENTRLFVAQNNTNNRVAVYDVELISNGENAINVLGQADFTGYANISPPTSASTVMATGLAYDNVNDLIYVSGYGGFSALGNYVKIFDASLTASSSPVKSHWFQFVEF